MITDVLGAAEHRLVGTGVDVMEFLDSEPAPRTLLLHGARTGAVASPEVVRECQVRTPAREVTPAPARSLESDLAEVLRS